MDKLRNKYKEAQEEIKDLVGEHQNQKEELLDIIRSQKKLLNSATEP